MSQSDYSKELSIIVAAYNVESTIDRIFEHVLQSKHLDQIEVIVINDGSKDDTSKIAYSYADEYPELVRVIDKENGGHGSALSAGFREARGRFCRPVDGDDWLDPDGLDKVIEMLPSTNADMIVCDVETTNVVTGISKCISFNLAADKPQAVKNIVPIDPIPGYHATMYATEILKNIPEIDHHCFYVDNEYNVYPLFSVQEVMYLPVVVYVHTVGVEEQSTSLQSLIKNQGNMKTVFWSLMSYASQRRSNTAAFEITRRFALGLLSMYTRVCLLESPRVGRRNLYEFCCQVQNQFPYFFEGLSLPRSFRLYLISGKRCYGLLRLIANVKNRQNLHHIIW